MTHPTDAEIDEVVAALAAYYAASDRLDAILKAHPADAFGDGGYETIRDALEYHWQLDLDELRRTFRGDPDDAPNPTDPDL